MAQIRVVGHLLRGAVEDHLTHVMLPGLIGGTFWHLRLTLASPRDTLAT